MQVNILSQEQGMALLQILIPADVFSKAIDENYEVFKKNHDGFDTPRSEVVSSPDCRDILRQAVQDVLSDHYAQAIAQSGLQVASEPRVSVICADEEKGVEYQLEFALRPDVKLGKYKGIRVKMPEVDLTEEETELILTRAQKQNVQPVEVDRAAQMGDVATIDFTGYLDGEAFEGGAGTDYDLTLGSGTFIPGFEEQLVGASAGEDVEVNVSFPEAYHAPDLAGKAVVFRCKMKKVSAMENQPLTEEQKAQLLERAALQKKDYADQQIEDEVLGIIVEDARMEIPQAMIDSEVRICMQQFAEQVQAQGMDMETYRQHLGKTLEEMQQDMQPLATRRIRLRLVLSAIAEAEGLEVTREDVEAHWEKLARQYGLPAAQLKMYMGDADGEIRQEILNAKAYALLREETILEMEP